jgi:hypothetical protein
MPKYEIEITRRYSVEAKSDEHALANYRVAFDDIEPELVGLTEDRLIDPDDFEFLDEMGKATPLSE